MTDRFPILPTAVPPIVPATNRPAAKKPLQGPSFDQVLQGTLANRPLSFSQHARQRMQQRGIDLTPEQLGRLHDAVAQVQAKGGRDALVMLDNTALVVSAKNSTVVTVADREQLKNNVFTNIDSAIIA